MTIDQWLACVVADLKQRQLPDLRPVIEALARTTADLRAAAWNADASGTAEHRRSDDDR